MSVNTLEMRVKTYEDASDPLDYLVATIEIDGVPLADFATYAIDMKQLEESLSRDGEYFILTCWCGYPPCAGITQGIQVKHEDNIIVWRVTSTDVDEVTTYRFVRRAYLEAWIELVKHGKSLRKSLGSHHGAGKMEWVPDTNVGYFS